ncbi:DNA-deoxyinosine glycosylase [Clostridium sp. AM58-1XD]|uniref:DNA-deoxyinosine glycosylase n=1 Tax=Clostridium sp. AM58-1XD TaxID=2292307 RepID=UPI000E4F51A5|nr:DNA-deoxyinosine glycosylase [Clostridium sp. AM58-1XD]RGY98714.1 DNA-deoxyinosine glycosylase [Clostridium sp. AM58-1XD]
MKGQLETVKHGFEPVFDENSRVLVLGTMPSPKSREQGFYYGHPRNRFWPVLAEVLGEPNPETIEDKKKMALKHGIAIWDVLASCEIHGADDTSIKNPVPNDMSRILEHADIRAVFTTGGKATALFKKYCQKQTGLAPVPLPSTSPANCRITFENLCDAYQEIVRKSKEIRP